MCSSDLFILKKSNKIPGVIKILEYGVESINEKKYSWFSIPYVESLEKKLSPNMKITEVLVLLLHYLDIYNILRDNNILYNDFKIDHLCLFNNLPMVIDFGSAYIVDKKEEIPKDKIINFLEEFFSIVIEKLKLKNIDILNLAQKPFSEIEKYFLKNSNEQEKNYYYSIYSARNEYNKAKEGFENLIKENPKHLNTLINLSKIYYIQKDVDKSLDIIKKAYKISHNNLDILLHLGILHQRQGEFKKAIDYYDKALKLSPSNKKVIDSIGLCQQNIDSIKIDKKIAKINFKKIDILEKDKKELLSVYSKKHKDTNLIGFKNRLYLQGENTKILNDSYSQVSWDQYFDDLSQGSYRAVYTKQKRSYRPRAWYFMFKQFHILEKIFSIKKDKIFILDIGCSSGYLLRLLEGNYSLTDNKKIYYFGLDIRDNVLKRAVFSDKNDIEAPSNLYNIPASFIKHDVKEDLPFKDEQFDAVINLEMIKYLPVEQGEKLLEEIKRVLKPDGFTYISTTHREGLNGYIEGLSHQEFAQKIKARGLELQKVSGSQTNMQHLFNNVRSEHAVAIKQLLEYYPPEIVSAFFIPLYPHLASQVLYMCTK